MKTPLFSVIIPTFNRPEQTRRAVESVLAQTLPNYQLIVIDDGSDLAMGEVQHLVELSGGQYLQTSRGGVARARNCAARQSNGEYLAFLDSDDLWKPEKLARQADYIRQNPELKILQTLETWYRCGSFVNARNFHRPTAGELFFRSLQLCAISPSSAVIKRELFETLGGFDENFTLCEDYDLWLRVCAQHQVGLVLQELVIKHGGHTDQLSRSQVALDRFRVYSIAKLLVGETLSHEKALAAQQELRRKVVVLRKGAAKHKRVGWLQVYREIEQLLLGKPEGISAELAKKLAALLEIASEVVPRDR